MMQRLRLAVSTSVLLLSTAALADAPDPDEIEAGTVVVVTPAPVVIGPQAQPAPPGAMEAPPPPVVASAAPAPQNEAWSNVSHINGTPVPVGERQNYLHKWKKTNITTNPLGWMVGFWGLSVSQAVHGNVAIRGDANLFRPIGGSDDRGYEVGVTLPIYFKRVYQGPFIEPGVLMRDLDTTDDEGAFVGPQFGVGWHWTFDSGLNAAIAFGLARRIGDSSDEESYDTPIEPVGYFRVGYAY